MGNGNVVVKCDVMCDFVTIYDLTTRLILERYILTFLIISRVYLNMVLSKVYN